MKCLEAVLFLIYVKGKGIYRWKLFLPMKICSPSSPGDMKKKEQVLQDMFVIFDFQVKWRSRPLLDNVFTLHEAIFAVRCLWYGRNCAPNNIITSQININPHSPKLSSMTCLWKNLMNFIWIVSIMLHLQHKQHSHVTSQTKNTRTDIIIVTIFKSEVSWNIQLSIRAIIEIFRTANF